MQANERFRGTSRFSVEGRLGAGGMGVVYRARDLDRGETVALKTMVHLDAEALLRFKKEFRSLADISHPNVVQLYELFSAGDEWFFTMELVEGVDLVAWMETFSSSDVGRDPTSHQAYSTTVMAIPVVPAAGAMAVRDVARLPGSDAAPARMVEKKPFAVTDTAQLRSVFRQLAAGLVAIHSAGKLHRDVKPSNILVTPAGRVVLLDFGVADDLANRVGHRVEEFLAGTPAYMAPEQARAVRASPASDWYSVGCVLYEALTGRLPFDGAGSSIVLRKQSGMPEPPSHFVSGVPADLEELTMELLAPDPLLRPTGEQVLARLRAPGSSMTDDVGSPASTPSEMPFVGRRHELDRLQAAFDASLEGPVVVMLHGRSGMGKSALASRFLGELSAKREALVLSGRCYEREAVPFKAVDPLVDELRRWLSRLPEADARALLPPDIDALARVFPVLGDLADVEYGAASRDVLQVEPHELRRRAFAALRELLFRIARDHRLVVHIDDLQWCDMDSERLLEALVADPAPPWMLICAFRSATAQAPVPLPRLRVALAGGEGSRLVEEVELRELALDEAEELARTIVDSGDRSVAALVTAEAGGHPLFLAELARWANERATDPQAASGLSLEQVVLSRVARLPPDARVLLETLSVAGGPLPHSIASRASQLASRMRMPALVLRGARLVVTRGLGDGDSIETAHDRIRQTIAESLDDDRRRACHARIARALADDPSSDAEAVFAHFRAAGDHRSARGSVLAAAEAADRALAFARAAGLYRLAIELRAGPLDVLHRQLGDVLANTGAVAESAEAYFAGAEHATKDGALELRRLAAEGFLKSGHNARGLEVLRSVLDEVGLGYQESDGRVIASLLWHQARLRVAPPRRRLRSAETILKDDLVRIDAAFAASTGLALLDPLRGADYGAQGLVLALEASEPVRLGRALAVAAWNEASRGEPARSRAESLVRDAERIAHEIDEPHTRALALMAAGTVHYLLGEWRAARMKLERAEEILQTRCRAVAWELTNAQSRTCNVLILTGELREASRRVPAMWREARERQDLFALMQLVYPASVARLVADDIQGAMEIASVGENGERDVMSAGRWGAYISSGSVDRYRGEGVAAWRRVMAESTLLETSVLWRSAIVRVFSQYEQGLSAISAATAGFEPKRCLAAAERWAQELAIEKLGCAPALGLLLRAGVAAVRGERSRACAALDAAIPLLDTADLGYLAACARHAKGTLFGGSAGRSLVAEGRAFLDAQGVVAPERCFAMSAPGFPG